MYLVTRRLAKSEIKYLSHQLVYMRVFGMWNDFTDKRKRRAYNFYTRFIFLVQVIHLIGSVIHIVTSMQIAGLNILLFTIGIIAKEIIVLSKHQEIASLIQFMQQVLDNAPNYGKRTVIRCEQLGRLLIDLSAFTGSFVVIFIHTPSIMALFSQEGDRILPHKVHYPFDEKTQYGHLLAMFLQTTYGPLSAAITIPIHILPICIMIHLCGQLAVLNDGLKNLDERVVTRRKEDIEDDQEVERRADQLKKLQHNYLRLGMKTRMIRGKRILNRSFNNRKISNCNNNSGVETQQSDPVLVTKKENSDEQIFGERRRLDELSESAITECVQSHETIYRMTREFQNIFGPIFFSHLLVNSFSIWLLLFEITTQMNNNFSGMLGYIIYLNMSLMDIAIICYVGSELISRSVDVADAAYTTPWYTSTKKFKFIVARMIHRAQKPIRVQGAYIFELSKTTLFLILKASITNFMVVWEMQSGKKESDPS